MLPELPFSVLLLKKGGGINCTASERSGLGVDVLEAGKMGKQSDLSEFDYYDVIMAKWLDHGIFKTTPQWLYFIMHDIHLDQWGGKGPWESTGKALGKYWCPGSFYNR